MMVTPEQEAFAAAYVELGNATEQYRQVTRVALSTGLLGKLRSC
jgi:hypothetical protein